MSAIAPAVRYCIPMFLETIADVKLGQTEGAAVTERRQAMATTVLAFVVYGDQPNLDLGDIAIAGLAAATLELCEKPQDLAAVNAFVSATDRFNEVQGSLDE